MLPATGSTSIAAMPLSPLVEQRLHRGEIVERERPGVAHRRRRSRRANREAPASRRRSRPTPAAVGMAVVAAVELEDEGRPVAARARRTALIVASVPELTNRTMSTDGKVATTRSASRSSSSVGAPNVVPRPRRLDHGLEHLRMGMPQDQRTPGEHQVHVAVAVHVHQPRALAPLHEARRAADTAERAHRAVDPARDDALRGGEQSLGCGSGSVVLTPVTRPPLPLATSRRPSRGR